MFGSREVLTRLKPADISTDIEAAGRILTPEYLKQPGAKIAGKFLDMLGIPDAQWSSYDSRNTKNHRNEQTLAEELTNKAGAIHRNGFFRFFSSNFLSRDPRHFLEKNLDPKLLDAMDPKLAGIFENEFSHHEFKKDKKGENQVVLPFAYLRLPGGIDCVLKGYWHDLFGEWQEEHGEYLAKTAKNAQVLCIEGFSDRKFGDSLEACWEKNLGYYNILMREAVRQSFDGLFTEIDIRDNSKMDLDSTKDWSFPNIPDEFYRKYFNYLDKFFPVDASQIKNSQNLKEILKRLSLTVDGSLKYDKRTNIENIHTHFPTYVDRDANTQLRRTGFEYGEGNISDAMAAIKLHLIANEMYEGRIEKGIIVDFEGAAHLQAKYFFLRNPFYALMTVLKSPHFILTEQLAKKDDASSLYPAFSPDRKMFQDMFKQIWRLEFAKPEKIGDRTEIESGPKQMPMKKHEVPGRDKVLSEKLGKLDVGGIIAASGAK